MPAIVRASTVDAIQQIRPYSLSGRTPYGEISWSLEVARFASKLFPMALKFDRHLGSSAAKMPIKLQSDTIIVTFDLVASRLHEVWRLDVLPLNEFQIVESGFSFFYINFFMIQNMLSLVYIRLSISTAPNNRISQYFGRIMPFRHIIFCSHFVSMMLPYNHIGLEVISKSVPDDMDADTTHLISYFIFANTRVILPATLHSQN